MIKFKKKEFSIGSSAYTGALVGGSIGSVLGGSAPLEIPRISFLNKGHLKSIMDKYDNLSDNKIIKETKKIDGKKTEIEKTINTVSPSQRLALLGVSTAVGAVLGALVGLGKSINEKYNRNTTVDNRLMRPIIDNLKKLSFKEGVDFTRNPKEANILKTKVCIVLSKNAGEFKILVNVVDDPKLKYKSDKIIKSLKGNYQVRNNSISNRYNEINISTVSNVSSNVNTTVEIVSGFIKAGYPVYLVEVG